MAPVSPLDTSRWTLGTAKSETWEKEGKTGKFYSEPLTTASKNGKDQGVFIDWLGDGVDVFCKEGEGIWVNLDVDEHSGYIKDINETMYDYFLKNSKPPGDIKFEEHYDKVFTPNELNPSKMNAFFKFTKSIDIRNEEGETIKPDEFSGKRARVAMTTFWPGLYCQPAEGKKKPPVCSIRKYVSKIQILEELASEESEVNKCLETYKAKKRAKIEETVEHSSGDHSS
jgi:hypothetical protein